MRSLPLVFDMLDGSAIACVYVYVVTFTWNSHWIYGVDVCRLNVATLVRVSVVLLVLLLVFHVSMCWWRIASNCVCVCCSYKNDVHMKSHQRDSINSCDFFFPLLLDQISLRHAKCCSLANFHRIQCIIKETFQPTCDLVALILVFGRTFSFVPATKSFVHFMCVSYCVFFFFFLLLSRLNRWKWMYI